MKLIAVDLECTSSDPETAEPWEAAAVSTPFLEAMDVRKPVDYFNVEVDELWGVDQDFEPGAMAACDFRKEDLGNAPHFSKRIVEFVESLHNKTIVLHNAAFDLKILDRLSNGLLAAKPPKFILDTWPLARLAWPELSSHQLQTLFHGLGLSRWPGRKQHRAKDDCKTTLLVFKEIVRKLDELGFETCDRDLQDLSMCMPLVSTFPIGKHKGTELSKVPVSYLQWWTGFSFRGRPVGDTDENKERWELTYYCAEELINQGFNVTEAKILMQRCQKEYLSSLYWPAILGLTK